ncbi:ABC protein [Mrakia frigida]|uniref:ABC protein n=1 Tax=Mrakia frigida TaxID=29902 RepID=UPI003FCC1BCE
MDIKRKRSDTKSQSGDEGEEQKTEGGARGAHGGKLKGNALRMKDLGEGEVEGGKLEGKWRKKWYQIHRPKNPPPPPPLSLDDAPVLPVSTASIFSILSYTWITPIMKLGYQRPLQATDLWKMDETREAERLASRLFKDFDKRRLAAEDYNERLSKGEVKPSIKRRLEWMFSRGKGSSEEQEKEWRSEGGSGKRKPSLAYAINDGIWKFFWSGGLFKVFGDTAGLMGPLVTKQIILFAQSRARHSADPESNPQPHIGRGIGMAFGLFFLTVFASVCQHQFFWRSMSVGVSARASLSTCVYRTAMVLTQKERSHLTNGKLLSHLSADISRVDYAFQWFHAWWTAPIQLAITAVLLILQIGPSALVGIALFIFLTPVQTRVMRMQFQVRKSSMKWTDSRSRLLQELLGSFAIIKYFTLERPFLERINTIRGNELVGIRKILIIRAANQAIAMSLPTLAAVVSFIAYVGSGNELDPAKIFTALSLFQLLRQPLMFLPRALSAIADASSALERLEVVFMAETMEDARNINPSAKLGINVVDASFEWSTASPETEAELKSSSGRGGGGGGRGGKGGKRGKKSERSSIEAGAKVEEQKEPFKVEGLNMVVERGQLCALVGGVGSGKSSILAGLIGEMKQTKGDVIFGGRVAYCAQSAFITNATLRDNIVFGQDWDEERYWQAVTDSSLIADCELLPDGDLSEIGEKGINLSGGQKQRVNVARALYNNADIVIFDDPLSAVDAHVAQSLFQDAMIGALKSKGKTVLLVTHALHILPEVDFIYTVENGVVVEQGTYPGLMASKGAFFRLQEEHGGNSQKHDEEDEVAEEDAIEQIKGLDIHTRKEKLKIRSGAEGTGKLEGRLMKAEKRTVGSVSKTVYRDYLRAGKGKLTLPLVIGSASLMQGAQIMSSVWLVYWQSDHFNTGLGFYMGLYAMFGVLQAFFTLSMGCSMGLLSYLASGRLHHNSVSRLFFAPMSLFNSTPLGRIMSVFGRDIDTVDNQLADSLRMAAMVLGNVLGSTILIAIYFPYFLAAVAVILVGYAYFASYYRASARELKRLDAMLRSLLYAHFSESLSGLATIRAYGESPAFIKQNAAYMDLENRAYFLTVTNQRWLAIRLDSLGAVMSFVVAIMCVVGVNGISAAQVGLVLSFTVSLTQQFGMITRQTAEVENNMNAVERVVHYSSDRLAQEAPYEIEKSKPAASWPSKGALVFEDVVMAYREDLQPVLHGISMDIKVGEKIGIVGRTGAGKSSIMSALFRLVEISSGTIFVDGIDISTLGLVDLRSKISIIPQDPQLFSGTIRTNLDPFSEKTDHELWSALKRAYLVPELSSLPEREKGDDMHAGGRFGLDTVVDDDGCNLSVGERGLVSLARALVKDSKVIVLDEATASVDLETDSKIQTTITREFKDKTLLCIAHRLRTILSYDRILVLDAGRIAEFDTPLNLFSQEAGVFRSMCEKSRISREDIELATEGSL